MHLVHDSSWYSLQDITLTHSEQYCTPPWPLNFFKVCGLRGVHLSLNTKNHMRSQHILETPYIQAIFFIIKQYDFNDENTSENMYTLKHVTYIHI